MATARSTATVARPARSRWLDRRSSRRCSSAARSSRMDRAVEASRNARSVSLRPGWRAALPLLRPCLPDPAVQLALGAPEVGPALGGHREVAHGPQPLDVVVQPGPQPGPGADECLVRHLEAVVVRGDETGRDEALDEVAAARAPAAAGSGGAGGSARASPSSLSTTRRSISSRSASCSLGGQGTDDLFRRPRHGLPDAAGLLVAVDGERRLPRAVPRSRAGRGRGGAGAPGSPSTSRTRRSTRPGSSRSPACSAGPFDRSPQVVGRHRGQQVQPLLDPAGEGRVRRELADPVGAQRDDAGVPARPARGGRAKNAARSRSSPRPDEGLLALVDDEHGGCRPARPPRAPPRGAVRA